MKLAQVVLIAFAASLALPAVAQTASDMQILADKVKADKKLVVAANMQLTDTEAKAFWPVYDAYQADLQKLNQRVGALITNYATEYNKGAVSGETAKKLLNEMLAVEEAEVKLKRSYVPRFEKAIPGVKVARYMQVENKIRAVIKYELASNIPLVQ
jgi:CII-binding regulator of phage lambda lysogenization HflD